MIFKTPTIEKQVIAWLSRIGKREHLCEGIVAFNFCLFETAKGYAINVYGSKEFDAQDDEWAVNVDFKPKKEFFLYLKSRSTKGKTWQNILEEVSSILGNYVQSPGFQVSIFKGANAITTGFADGDLIRIK